MGRQGPPGPGQAGEEARGGAGEEARRGAARGAGRAHLQGNIEKIFNLKIQTIVMQDQLGQIPSALDLFMQKLSEKGMKNRGSLKWRQL